MKCSKRQAGIAGGILMLALSSACTAESLVPGSRARICLNGEWDAQAPAKEDKIPASGWEKIRVPAEWRYRSGPSAAGVRKDWMTSSTAWYKLDFIVPASWNDGRIVRINFDGANHYAKVLVNGLVMGDHYGCLTTFGFDITAAVKFGQTNTLNVFLHDGRTTVKKRGYSDGAPAAFRRADRGFGIHRDVYLACQPRVHVENTFVQTSFRKKEIKVKLWVRNSDRAVHTLDVAAQVQKDGKTVLKVGTKTVTVNPGAMEALELTQPWPDPACWGFGQWGAPVLYFLETDLVESGKPVDIDFTRFGFREFWCEKGQFWLNGKKIFILGDTPQYAGLGELDNRQFWTVFARAEREANISFMRSHTYVCAPAYYDTMDELGMMVEPEFATYPSDLSKIAEFIPYEKTVVRDVVTRLWNHPSIVMWSDDNEGSSAKADPKHSLNHKALHEEIKGLDPTRPVDSNGNNSLFSVKKLFNIDFKPDVFNVHPYGRPSYPEVKRQMNEFMWDNEAPVYMGELTCKIPVTFQAPSVLFTNQAEAFLGYRQMGRFWRESIISFYKKDLAGCAPHTMDTFGYWGPVGQDTFALGPGKCVITNWPESVPWPSLSGPDVKTVTLTRVKLWNWFDPKEPAYTPNINHKMVGEAYREATGSDVGALNPHRAPEVIVKVTRAGKPVAGVYVFLLGLEKQALNPEGVMTDKDGTAWFVLKEPGAYEAVCETEQGAGKTKIKAEWGKTNDRPGYEHIRHAAISL